MSDRLTDNPERPWPNLLMDVGAIVGHTTATTSRLWFRTNTEGKFAVLVFRPLGDDANTNAIKNLLKQVPLPIDTLTSQLAALCHPAGTDGVDTVQVKSFNLPLKDDAGEAIDTDTTHVIDLDGLDPFTDYHYALVQLNASSRCLLGHRRLHSFRTLTDQNAPFSFGFFSCHMPYKVVRTGLFKHRTKAVNEEMWDYMNDSLSRHRNKGTDGNLGFIIAGGDQVYADGVDTLSIWKLLNKVMRKEADGLHPCLDTMLSWYRDIYRGYWGFAGLREVYSSFPTYMM